MIGADQATPTRDSLARPQTKRDAPVKIVLVEDELIVALNLRQRLTQFGYTVCAVASSGSEALEVISRHKPDLVVMDIHIDGQMDGIETVTKIPNELNIRVIYLSAGTEPSILARAKQTKPYGILSKPFSESELHATIQTALAR